MHFKAFCLLVFFFCKATARHAEIFLEIAFLQVFSVGCMVGPVKL